MIWPPADLTAAAVLLGVVGLDVRRPRGRLLRHCGRTGAGHHLPVLQEDRIASHLRSSAVGLPAKKTGVEVTRLVEIVARHVHPNRSSCFVLSHLNRLLSFASAFQTTPLRTSRKSDAPWEPRSCFRARVGRARPRVLWRKMTRPPGDNWKAPGTSRPVTEAAQRGTAKSERGTEPVEQPLSGWAFRCVQGEGSSPQIAFNRSDGQLLLCPG